MAVIRCLAPADGLQGVMACLRESESLAGILAVVLLTCGWLALQYLAEARRDRRCREVKPVIPAFGSGQHADAMYTFANREYYQVMLAEMEKALFAAGYELTRNESLRMALPDTDRRVISRQIFRARQGYTSPSLSEQAMNACEDAATKEGYTGMWLNVLIRGSERQGWYITRSQ